MNNYFSKHLIKAKEVMMRFKEVYKSRVLSWIVYYKNLFEVTLQSKVTKL